MQYLIEHSIQIDRLVLIAPSELKGRSQLEALISEFTGDKEKLKDLIGEIVVVHSRDD